MPSSCKEIRAELAECILKSNCVLVDGLSAKECLRAENEYRVPVECTAIKRSFFECKRGMNKRGYCRLPKFTTGPYPKVLYRDYLIQSYSGIGIFFVHTEYETAQ
ncbi:hypothetical protein BGZ72_007719 [Mortierella alpina]|nr:hypothetical protein BGZ72_007719 [Mortierella alpina]